MNVVTHDVVNLQSNDNAAASEDRVIDPKGVHRELFQSDVFAICDTVQDMQNRLQQYLINSRLVPMAIRMMIMTMLSTIDKSDR